MGRISQSVDRDDLATISIVNSTAVPLGNGATFAGEWEEAYFYAAVAVSAFADQPSAVDGLKLEWSQDKITIVHDDTFTLVANKGRFQNVPPMARYFRVRCVNGATPQTKLLIQTIYHLERIKPNTHSLLADLTDDEDAELGRAVISGRGSDGIYRPVLSSASGQLLVSTPPPSAPPGGTLVSQLGDGNVGAGATIESSYTITNGKVLRIERLIGGGDNSVAGGRVELVYRPTGLPASDQVIAVGYVAGGNLQFDLADEFVGDGTRQIALKRVNAGGGTIRITGKWTGYEV